MTTVVREFLEHNIDLIDSTPIYTVIAQHFVGSGRDILELLSILKEAGISIDYTNSTIDDIYQVLKLVFENNNPPVNLRACQNIKVKKLKNQIKIEASEKLGQMHPADVEQQTKESEINLDNILYNVTRVCNFLLFDTSKSKLTIEDRWGQRYYRAITCRKSIYINF